MNCVACGERMDPVLAPAVTHPNCLTFTELEGEEDIFGRMLKQKLTDIILWYDKQNPRSKQVQIGPSEIGDPCDRRIGYRIAGLEGCNTEFDPWAAIVGTALHSWLDEAVQAWMKDTRTDDWLTETTLVLSEFIQGHADLYNKEHAAVIDWKSAGPDVMKRVKRDGPSPGYMIQTHVYGYLFEQADMPVRKVSLVFLPRAGWLRDMYVWSADYDRAVAEQALTRLYGIAQQVVSMDVLNQSHRWEQIGAVPSNSCAFCPWYDPARDPEQGADHSGCPGR